MPRKITKEELSEMRMKRRSGVRKEIMFGKDIDELKAGDSLIITKEDWEETKLKTKIAAYYYGKYVKGVDEKQRVISYETLPDGFVITKKK
jgi:hypothetical protein